MEDICGNGPNPAVSVIIPCYNQGQYIREAIVSVEQCEKDLYEIIIINDGSTDETTKRILAELEDEGYYVINQPNQGVSASRNNGIRIARGRYILPLDSDDKIKSWSIPKSIDILDKQPDVGVVYGRAELFGATSSRLYPDAGAFDLHRIVLANYIANCAVIRKTALEECDYYDTQLSFWEDWDLWLTMASKGWQFHFEDAEFFSYRISPDSMTPTVGNQPANIQMNTEYLCRKHALLLRQVVIEQQAILSDHPRAIRYSRLWAEKGLGTMLKEGLTDTTRRLKKRFYDGDANRSEKVVHRQSRRLDQCSGARTTDL